MSKIATNKSGIALPEFVAVGRTWVILQNTPAGTFTNFISAGIIKTTERKAE